jgi:hypothetical protein
MPKRLLYFLAGIACLVVAFGLLVYTGSLLGSTTTSGDQLKALYQAPRVWLFVGFFALGFVVVAASILGGESTAEGLLLGVVLYLGIGLVVAAKLMTGAEGLDWPTVLHDPLFYLLCLSWPYQLLTLGYIPGFRPG